MKALEEDITKKLKSKDKTISALEEECKELHGIYATTLKYMYKFQFTFL